MRTFTTARMELNTFEFAELSMGFDPELFAGVPGETVDERQVRLDVAREVLRDLRATDPERAEYAEALLRTAPVLMKPTTAPGNATAEVRAA